MDAYRKDLTGRGAAWAAKKYRGHWVPPESNVLSYSEGVWWWGAGQAGPKKYNHSYILLLAMCMLCKLFELITIQIANVESKRAKQRWICVHRSQKCHGMWCPLVLHEPYLIRQMSILLLIQSTAQFKLFSRSRILVNICWYVHVNSSEVILSIACVRGKTCSRMTTLVKSTKCAQPRSHGKNEHTKWNSHNPPTIGVRFTGSNVVSVAAMLC
jgi:hypothetical protein